MVILLDSNIWISLAINSDLEFIPKLIKKRHQIVTCQHLVFELLDVLSRTKFKKYFPDNYLEEFIKFHQSSTVMQQVTNIESVVSDEKDDYLFALCKVSNANFFVTGDKLLLAEKKYGETSIVNLSEFKRLAEVL